MAASAYRKETFLNMTIPHIIHQTWKTESIPEDLVQLQQSWKQMHPDWTYYLWTDFDNHEFIRKFYPWFLPIYEGYPLNIMRADAVRYFILNHFGGIYADLDYECLKPMQSFLHGRELIFGLEPAQHLKSKISISFCMEKILCNAWMASCSNHPFWPHMFQKLIEYHKNPGVLESTGPFALTWAYDSFANKEEISVVTEELLYPLSNEQISPADRFFIIQDHPEAYGVHYWRGGWWNRDSIKNQSIIPAVQLVNNREVSKYWLNTDRYLAIQNELNVYPKISCIMITNDRPLIACKAVDCYQHQTYRNRELVIIDDGSDPTLEQYVESLCDKTVRFIRLESEGKALGDLRNMAVKEASGEYVAQWDDDDLSDPYRLEIQMAAIQISNCEVCLLLSHMIWFPERQRLAVSNQRFWESSFVCLKRCVPAYPSLRKGEDTEVIENILLHHRAICIDNPRLYLYIFHGGNTFEEAHWDEYWQAASKTYEGPTYQANLSEISHNYRIDLDEYSRSLRRLISDKKTPQYETANIQISSDPFIQPKPPVHQDKNPTILILIPVKNAEKFLAAFVENIRQLTYPHRSISIAFLESDSSDSTFSALDNLVPELKAEFKRVKLYKKDYGFQLNGPRWEIGKQYIRRSVLAKSRNYLLSKALQNEDWVIWMDVDVARYPADIIQTLLSARKDIIVPNCKVLGSERSFDLNTYKLSNDAKNIDWRNYLIDGLLQPPAGVGRWYLNDLQMFDIVEVDGVGATMLMIKADLHREGLIFPTYSYQYAIETEALALMARDMGYQSFGLPNVCIYHPAIE
jgi:glycosyltransferase involved in cell wall biosynthesis